MQKSSEITAVVYARVSTAKQAEEELPIQSQLEQCLKKGADHNAAVVKTFIDDGISGRSASRPAFQDAIAYCELYSPTYFITWSTSRFARNKLDASLYKMRLAKCGTEIIYVSMAIDRASDGGWITEGIMELFDEFYSRQISSDTKRSMIKNSRDGYWNGGSIPIGYEPLPSSENPKRKRLSVVPEQATIVRKIFEMRLTGIGSKSIAMWLNERQHTNRGSVWTKNAVTNLLHSHAVIGRVAFNRRDPVTNKLRPQNQCEYVDAHEPIVSADEWEAVQRLMDRASTKTPGSALSTALFTGILVCGKCGKGMRTETAKGRTRRYRYYNCSSAQKGSGCKNRRIDTTALDDWLIDAISEKIFTPRILNNTLSEITAATSDWGKNKNNRRREIHREIQNIESRTEKLFQLLETHGADTPNLGDLTKRLRKNKSKLAGLEAELIELESQKSPEIDITRSDIQDLSECLVKVLKTPENPEKVRNFLSRFIEKITVNAGNVEIAYDPNLLLKQKQVVHSNELWLPEKVLLGTKTIEIGLPERFKIAA